MGEVVQFSREPRAPYFLLAWDQAVNNCRLDYVHRGGLREYVGSGKDYFSVRDASRQCAHEAGLPLVDQIDPVLGMRCGR
ncbi:hypothetical protein [Sphingopyxis sp. RIFCSPHIGHO2_12_FULL_65_19]|uniref:hypothetical protein n=1 Tax=Sphingopyxis sp. RIFCSPHIGHO2_12_FULL_65_19 TaxID=1802172 RepID=UPI0008D1E0D4|nr:hypothetical protein [Sphingopyxis sp. RIFCSPHIGHO2_12_FULL_65_19]OHD07557.1 MAG: hypothetical protein A3E77_09230 [Sphingopyxis sp. RIFCSPHIGHO2_12_FULL_65_19]